MTTRLDVVREKKNIDKYAKQVTIKIDGVYGEATKTITLSIGDYFKTKSGKVIKWEDFYGER